MIKNYELHIKLLAYVVTPRQLFTSKWNSEVDIYRSQILSTFYGSGRNSFEFIEGQKMASHVFDFFHVTQTRLIHKLRLEKWVITIIHWRRTSRARVTSPNIITTIRLIWGREVNKCLAIYFLTSVIWGNIFKRVERQRSNFLLQCYGHE